MSDAPRYLLIKRGLYYRPNNQGYTGKRSEAGRYPETDADDMSGITAVHEDNAAEYAPACWQETINQDLRARLNAAERERDALREALHLTAPDGIRQPRRSELEYNAADDVDEDVMRMTPRQLTDDDKDKLVAIKGNAASLHGFFGTLGTSRELSLAKTKLEEAVMWAVKHVTA